MVFELTICTNVLYALLAPSLYIGCLNDLNGQSENDVLEPSQNTFISCLSRVNHVGIVGSVGVSMIKQIDQGAI